MTAENKNSSENTQHLKFYVYSSVSLGSIICLMTETLLRADEPLKIPLIVATSAVSIVSSAAAVKAGRHLNS